MIAPRDEGTTFSIRHRLGALALALLATGVAPLSAAPEARGHARHPAALASPASASAAAVTGQKKVAVILFNLSNNSTSKPWTPAYVRGVYFTNADSVAAYYREASYGKLNLSGKVLGWYTIPMRNAGCNPYAWADKAEAKAKAKAKATVAGETLSRYDYVVYAFPENPNCDWVGAGEVSGTRSWLNGMMTLRTGAHELGHNFGLDHAGALYCTQDGRRVTLTAPPGVCFFSELGDPFSVIGLFPSTRLPHSSHRLQLGWLDAGDTLTVTTSGTYTLLPLEFRGDAPRLIRVPRGNGTFVDLEFRRPFGLFDNFQLGDEVVNGVTLRLPPDARSDFSRLLDTTPQTLSFADAALAVAQTFVDPLTQTKITTTAVSPLGATVAIQLAPPADLVATAVSDPPPWPAPGATFGVTDTATDVGKGIVRGVAGSEGCLPAAAPGLGRCAGDALVVRGDRNGAEPGEDLVSLGKGPRRPDSVSRTGGASPT